MSSYSSNNTEMTGQPPIHKYCFLKLSTVFRDIIIRFKTCFISVSILIPKSLFPRHHDVLDVIGSYEYYLKRLASAVRHESVVCN